MHARCFPARPRRLTAALVLAALLPLVLTGATAAHATSGAYKQHNLVSDIPGLARVTDPHLVNSWGIAFSPTGPFLIADNGTGVATQYNGGGRPFPPHAPLVVTIPPPAGSPAGTTAAPTGNIFNPTSDFVVSQGAASGPSRFLFDTEDGTISGWNPGVDATHAILAVDNSASGAVYKGLAMGHAASGNFLYATNFHAGTVEMFDAHFRPVKSFTDATLSNDCPLPGQCFAPFGIRNIGGNLFVTYALQNAEKHDDVAGPGNGFVDIFDTNGTLMRRFASGGTLNSPWGLALAPGNFGQFSNDLLIGDFGDGHINAFDPSTGVFRGQLQDRSGTPLTISGLWGLTFGNGGDAGGPNTLFFAAGINDEADGLFGSLAPAS